MEYKLIFIVLFVFYVIYNHYSSNKKSINFDYRNLDKINYDLFDSECNFVYSKYLSIQFSEAEFSSDIINANIWINLSDKKIAVAKFKPYVGKYISGSFSILSFKDIESVSCSVENRGWKILKIELNDPLHSPVIEFHFFRNSKFDEDRAILWRDKLIACKRIGEKNYVNNLKSD